MTSGTDSRGGAFVANSGSTAFFDGAVRGRSLDDSGANISNSLKGFNSINLGGGVYEIDNSGGGGGTFTANLVAVATGTGASTGVNFGPGGGGFSAFGGNVAVTLNSGSALTWNATNFVASNDSLIFGSQTANRVLTFTNPIDLGGAAREIRVIDNTSTTSDAAVLSGALSNGSLNKTGGGTLRLSAANTYSGSTAVLGGRLEVSAGGDIKNTSGVTVNGSGAEFKYNSATAYTQPLAMTQGTISGTGSISASGGVSIGTTAILSPGNSPGLQAYTTGLTWAAGGTYLWEINDWTGVAGTAFDQVAVSGDAPALNITAGSDIDPNRFRILITSLSNSNVSGTVQNFDGTVNRSFPIATYSSISGFNASKFWLDTSAFTNTYSGTFTISDSGSTVMLNYLAPFTSTTYTLVATAGTSAIRVNGTTGITATVTNTGTGTADSLAVTGLGVSVSPSGSVTISPTSGTAANTNGTVVGNGSFTGSAPGAYTFTPSASGTNVNLGTAATLTSTGSTTVTVYNPASANTLPTSLSFGNIYASGSFTSQNLSIWNTGTASASFQEGLNATISGSTGNATAGGSISNLYVAGGTSTAISVGLTAGSAGVQSGTVTLGFASNGTLSGLSNLTLASQSVALTGTVWNAAAVNSITTPVSLGNVRVGGTFGTSNLSIQNTAASGSYTEVLGATATTSGLASSSGSVVGLAGGGTSTAISVGLGGSSNTGSAGVKSGTATIAFTSTGGPGTASISNQTIAISGTVWNAAVATTSGSVNLGTVIVGSTSAWSQALSITNSAPGSYSESLNAAFGTLSGVTTNSGSFNLLAAGSTNNTAMTVALSTASVGNLNGSAQLTFQTDGQGTSSLAAAALDPQTVNVYGTVLDHATSSLAGTLLTGTTISLGRWNYETNNWEIGSGTAQFSIYNIASLFGAQLTADLALLGVSGSANGFSTNLDTYTDIAGGSSQQFSIFADTTGWTTSGTQTVTYTISTSDKVGMAGATSSNTLTVTANVVVVPEPATIALAGIAAACAGYMAWRRRR